MKKIISSLIVMTSLVIPGLAHAESHLGHWGFGIDLGVPDGIAADLAWRPTYAPWLRADAAFTYNVIAPGLRGGLTLDPINYWIAPTATVEYGHAFNGTIPGQDVTVGYDYVNTHLGLEFGKQATFRIFIHGGPSWVWSNVNHIDSLFTNNGGLTVSNAGVRAFCFPAAKVGFNVLF